MYKVSKTIGKSNTKKAAEKRRQELCSLKTGDAIEISDQRYERNAVFTQRSGNKMSITAFARFSPSRSRIITLPTSVFIKKI